MLARHTLVPDYTAFSWTPASNELKWRYVVYYCSAVYSNHSNQDQGAIFFTTAGLRDAHEHCFQPR
jgi:hypothetical protein